jgi:hypothetical protein
MHLQESDKDFRRNLQIDSLVFRLWRNVNH